MEYTQVMNKLDNIGHKARETYNQLYGMYVLHEKGGSMKRPVEDSGLERTLNEMGGDIRPKVIATTKRGFFSTKEVYALTNYGDKYISTEIENTERIHKELSKIKSYNNIDKEVEKILQAEDTTLTDYYMKKAIFIDKLFDKPAKFYETDKLGEYISGKNSSQLKKKKKEVERFESRTSDNYNSSTDDLTTYAMMGILFSDNSSNDNHSSSSGWSSGCGGGSVSSGCGGGSSSSSSSGCGGGSSSGCGGGSSGCGGGGCGGGGCGGS